MANSRLSGAIKRNVVSHLFLASTILTSGAIINVIQVLLHILVKPVNKRLFHKLMYYVSWTWLARKFSCTLSIDSLRNLIDY